MQASSFARKASRYEEIYAVNGADLDRAMKRRDRQRKKKVGTDCFSGDLSSCGPKIPLYWAGCYHDNKMRQAIINPCQVSDDALTRSDPLGLLCLWLKDLVLRRSLKCMSTTWL